MELAIYFANYERLTEIDQALHAVDLTEIPGYLSVALFQLDPNLTDDVGNVTALKWMNPLMAQQCLDFTRLYFGQEFCQNLTPPPEEVEMAYYFSRQQGWQFTYVTGGYLAEPSLEVTRRNLEKLAELEPTAEVVFNDWGVFRMMRRDFPDFVPIMGRILNKQTRLNLFTETGDELPISRDSINLDFEELRRNQIEAYRDVNISNPDYLPHLHAWGVRGIDMDITPQGVERPEDGWNLQLGFYYPWGFIATARNCPTAGTLDLARMFIVKDKSCGKPCRKYNCSPNLLQFDTPLVMRGPTLFVFHADYAAPYFNGQVKYERLIYQPYIPL